MRLESNDLSPQSARARLDQRFHKQIWHNARMKKTDARKLPSSILEEKRRLSVRLGQEGMTRVQIGNIVGVHPDTVGRWLKACEAQGPEALKSRVRGRRQGDCRRLSQEQESWIQRLLIDRTPDQLRLPCALWTRELVKELIKAQLNIELPIRTVGHYLQRWGMTPRKPVKRTGGQQPFHVCQWLDKEYPDIQAKARAEGAAIYWGDETALRHDTQHEPDYASMGKTPVIRPDSRGESVNMISAIFNQGRVRFRLFDEEMDAAILIDFFNRLSRDAGCKVILILDNLRVHRAGQVREWLQGKEDRIELFYLSPCSSELNSGEYLNCGLKNGV